MKKLLTSLLFVLGLTAATYAQSQYQPYSFQFYQKFSHDLYSPQTRAHTSIKPFFVDDSLLVDRYDSLMNYGTGNDGFVKRSWVHRKLFNEHLIDVRNNEYTFYADFLPDLTIGRDFSGKNTTWLNTRGFQVGGTIGNKFSFYTSGFENQARFPNYYDTYTQQQEMVSGQGNLTLNSLNKRTRDWSYVTALLSYTPVKYLNISLGMDKTFIGDGYRSMLLSDFAAPYPLLRLTGTLGNVRYMAMWTYMNDPTAKRFNPDDFRKKWGAFQYLDWNVSNRVSLGFFQSVTWAAQNEDGSSRGFDFNYINPFIFVRPLESSANRSPDNVNLGFTGKYEISNQITAYAQLSLDEFEAKNFFSSNGSWRNKYGWQLGFRGADVFNVRSLNYLIEYNSARPYTFTERSSSIINYAHQREPLGHPFGANFREVVGIVNYSYQRFDFTFQGNYGMYGLDMNGLNYGKDIFKPYSTIIKELDNRIGQGLRTNLYYFEPKVAFLLNPKYNLRIELGGIFRVEKNDVFNDKTSMISLGLRSSFRNVYNDISRLRL
ncbi:gliding motility protein RemB [Mucilaginibacter sp. Bleaf8]|uniref:gliding motility protein RemB n=1 Tax=Mucilaginibacter sp. Bleaf8 TaxID=2834430 RepID=UPI001BCE6BD1|nr:gliding motility protein RemB [Mucilaginibacter sp. Bleaf8]MBS7565995.1 gliding motility protein RemB [Mucilaginibacter sp. Bleaf8]